MGKHDLGKRFRCYQCGCAFYDLGKKQAICPKCGADQVKAPKFEIPTEAKASRSKEKVVLPLPEDDDTIPEDFDEFNEVIIDEEDVEFSGEDEDE